jgi:hypothetical protein
MVMMGRNRTLILTGALVLAAGAAIAWFARGDGLRAGVGPFAADMTRCRERVFQDLRYPEFIEYIEESVWHTGAPPNFTIGGLVRLRGGNALPVVHQYECEAEGGRILRVEVR